MWVNTVIHFKHPKIGDNKMLMKAFPFINSGTFQWTFPHSSWLLSSTNHFNANLLKSLNILCNIKCTHLCKWEAIMLEFSRIVPSTQLALQAITVNVAIFQQNSFCSNLYRWWGVSTFCGRSQPFQMEQFLN